MGTVTHDQKWPGGNGNEELWNWSLINCLVSYPGHPILGWGLTPFAVDSVGIF